MTTLLGFLMIIALIVLIMKEKAAAPIIFGVLPIIAALILGFTVKDITDMYLDGFSGAAKNAVLAIFSVTFFFMMNEVGAFDPIVNFIVSKSQGNVTAVFVAASIIAMITSLDGQSASTIVVTAPVMYPIFTKMKIRPVNLAFIITMAAGVFMYAPYTSSMLAVSTALEIPVQDIWTRIIPLFVIGIVANLVMAVILAQMEKKRIHSGKNDAWFTGDDGHHERDLPQEKAISSWHKTLLPINWMTILILMACLFTNSVNGSVLFVFIFCISAFINFPNSREQVAIIRKAAPMAMFVGVVFLLAGGYAKVMSGTGMMGAMANSIIGLAPESITRYLHVILGAFALPINFILGPDTFYFGLTPLAGSVASSYGIPLASFAVTLMIGKGLGMLCSPTTPNLYLLTDMCGVSTSEYFKFTFFRLWAMALVLLVIGLIIGVAVI